MTQNADESQKGKRSSVDVDVDVDLDLDVNAVVVAVTPVDAYRESGRSGGVYGHDRDYDSV